MTKGGNQTAIRDTEVVYPPTSTVAHVLSSMRGTKVRTACQLTLSGIGDYRTIAKGGSVLPITCPKCRLYASRWPRPPWEREASPRPTRTGEGLRRAQRPSRKDVTMTQPTEQPTTEAKPCPQSNWWTTNTAFAHPQAYECDGEHTEPTSEPEGDNWDLLTPEQAQAWLLDWGANPNPRP